MSRPTGNFLTGSKPEIPKRRAGANESDLHASSEYFRVLESDKRKCWNLTWHSGSYSEKLVGKEDTTHPQNVSVQIFLEYRRFTITQQEKVACYV